MIFRFPTVKYAVDQLPRAGRGDPAIDRGVLIHIYGESFVRRIWKIFPEAENYLKRARFYGETQELRWLLTGIERNDPGWFALHVGRAKDIGINSLRKWTPDLG